MKTLLRALLLAVVSVAMLPAALAADTGAHAQPTLIPFELFHGNIVVEVTVPSGRTLPFVFDTGLSEGNIITAAAARALELESRGRAHFTDSSGAQGMVGVAGMDRITISGAVLHEQKFAIISVPPALTHRPAKPPIAGFIGTPLLKGAVVCIDYADRVLRRWPDGGFRAAGMASVPVKIIHGLLTIPVHIDGVQARLAVDTGSDGGVQLFAAFVARHDLRQRYEGMATYRALSGSGKRFHILRGTAETVRIGQTMLHDVSMAFINQAFNPAWGIDGLIGYRVLLRLNPCLDRAGRRMLWPASAGGG